MCQLVSISKKSNGDFAADFTIPTAVSSALTNKTSNSSSSKRILLRSFDGAAGGDDYDS